MHYESESGPGSMRLASSERSPPLSPRAWCAPCIHKMEQRVQRETLPQALVHAQMQSARSSNSDAPPPQPTPAGPKPRQGPRRARRHGSVRRTRDSHVRGRAGKHSRTIAKVNKATNAARHTPLQGGEERVHAAPPSTQVLGPAHPVSREPCNDPRPSPFPRRRRGHALAGGTAGKEGRAPSPQRRAESG